MLMDVRIGVRLCSTVQPNPTDRLAMLLAYDDVEIPPLFASGLITLSINLVDITGL